MVVNAIPGVQVWNKFANDSSLESERTKTAQVISAACWATGRWREMEKYLKQVVLDVGLSLVVLSYGCVTVWLREHF